MPCKHFVVKNGKHTEVRSLRAAQKLAKRLSAHDTWTSFYTDCGSGAKRRQKCINGSCTQTLGGRRRKKRRVGKLRGRTKVTARKS